MTDMSIFDLDNSTKMTEAATAFSLMYIISFALAVLLLCVLISATVIKNVFEIGVLVLLVVVLYYSREVKKELEKREKEGENK